MRRTTAAAVFTLALAACGGSSGGPASTPTPTPTPKPFSGPMQALGGSGVEGTVLVVKQTGSFIVTVTVKGLAPNSNHINHIHKGNCPGSPGPIATDVISALQPLAADASGNATATTMVPHDFVLPPEGWYANVHAGPDLQGANAKSISCGNLPTS
jgi:Cu/Zn superoxide dismutase